MRWIGHVTYMKDKICPHFSQKIWKEDVIWQSNIARIIAWAYALDLSGSGQSQIVDFCEQHNVHFHKNEPHPSGSDLDFSITKKIVSLITWWWTGFWFHFCTVAHVCWIAFLMVHPVLLSWNLNDWKHWINMWHACGAHKYIGNFYFITPIIPSEQYKLWSSPLCFFISPFSSKYSSQLHVLKYSQSVFLPRLHRH
jgi:hypothetical protein